MRRTGGTVGLLGSLADEVIVTRLTRHTRVLSEARDFSTGLRPTARVQLSQTLPTAKPLTSSKLLVAGAEDIEYPVPDRLTTTLVLGDIPPLIVTVGASTNISVLLYEGNITSLC